jgi:hypothetical protein
LYPAGTSKWEGSTGAEEKAEVLVCDSIKTELVGGGVFESEFAFWF